MTALVIDGILRLTSPLHISDPAGTARYMPRTNRIVIGASGGFPAVLTRTSQAMLEDAVSDKNPLGRVDFPVLPSNGLRGRLRRAGAAEVEASLRARNERLSMAAYQGMHCGAIGSAPLGTTPALAEVKAYRAHVFAGLFGGGARMIPSPLRVSEGVPLLRGLIDRGMIPTHAEEFGTALPSALAYRLFEDVPMVRLDDAAQYADREAESVIDNYEAEMLAFFERDLERATVRSEKGVEGLAKKPKKAKKSTTEDDVGDDEPELERGLRTFVAHQRVIPGTTFWMSMRLTDATDAQVGLFLRSLRRVCALSPRGIGGKTAHGYGRFQHRLMLRRGTEAPIALFEGQEEETALRTADPVIKGYLDASDAAIEALTPADIDYVFGVGA